MAAMLPGTVVAAHLRASAAALADGTTSVDTPAEFASVLTDVVAGQESVSASLARLAEYVRDSPTLSEVPAEELAALTEVLLAAGRAAGYAAEALAQSRPMLRVILEVTGADTHL